MDDWVLRFRMNGMSDDCVVVDKGGCSELRVLEARWELGEVKGRGSVSAAEVTRALQLARQVLGFKRPRFVAAAHGPTDTLDVEIRDGGGELGGSFLWGRESRDDAPLEPVEGEGAIEAFNELHALLTTIRRRAESPPLVGAATAAWERLRQFVAEAPREQDAPAAAATLVRALVSASPKRLSELERVIGPLKLGSDSGDRIGVVYRPPLGAPDTADFSKQVHRAIVRCVQDSPDAQDPPMVEYSLSFAVRKWPESRRNVLDEVLEQLAGPAVVIENSPHGSGRRYGAFVCIKAYQLFWFKELPSWAR